MNRRLLAIISISAYAVCVNRVSAQDASLCGPSEVRYFGCRTAKGKLISICGEARGLTQYRFGRPGKVELQSADLRYAHYMRYRTDHYEVSFDTNDTRYAVFDYVEGKQRSAGVQVTRPSGESVSIHCSGKAYSQLSKLESLLPCDEDNALNMGGCPDTPTPRECPPASLALHASEPPIEIRFKRRATPDGEVIDQLLVSRAKPALSQTLQVREVDPLSVRDSCSVRTTDINFDGYNDIVVDLRAGVANTYAQYWYYEPGSRSFKDLGEYPELQADAARKRLKTYERNGYGGREYEAREYSFAGGTLVLERREVQVAIANGDAFERTVSIRTGTEMKVIEKKRVDTLKPD